MLSPLRMPFRHARVAVSFITRNLACYPSRLSASTSSFQLEFQDFDGGNRLIHAGQREIAANHEPLEGASDDVHGGRRDEAA